MALIVNRPHDEQVRQLLTEAVTMLCKNMLTYSTDLCIEGLIGVTTDSTNVILVSIKETIMQASGVEDRNTSGQTESVSSPFENRLKSSKLKRRHNSSETEGHHVSTGSEQESARDECGMEEKCAMEEGRQETVFLVEDSVASIKQECETGRYDEGIQPAANKQCTSRKQAASVWWPPDFKDILSAQCSVSSESSVLPWSHTKGPSEPSLRKDAFHLTSHQSQDVSLHPTHHDSTRMSINKSLPKQHQTSSGDCIKKHGPLSFTVEQDPSGSTELFICECGEPFRHRSSLYRHQMMHLGMVYRCDSCGIVMNRKDNLLTHKRRYCLAHKQTNACS